jgi:hypothetical protein
MSHIACSQLDFYPVSDRQRGWSDMTGAILMTAAFAFLSSTIATIGNFAISRDFSDYEWDQDPISFWTRQSGFASCSIE